MYNLRWKPKKKRLLFKGKKKFGKSNVWVIEKNKLEKLESLIKICQKWCDIRNCSVKKYNMFILKWLKTLRLGLKKTRTGSVDLILIGV